MIREYKLLIGGGESVDSSTGETFDDINPATLENLATLQVAGIEDVDRAVEAAEAGFRVWSEVPAPGRAEVLFRAARIMQERKEGLARLMTEEMGKVLPETRGGDVQEAIDITIYAAGGRQKDVWGNNDLRTQGQVLHDRAKACRSCGHDNTLELSYCDSQLEDHASPYCRECDRVQACKRYAPPAYHKTCRNPDGGGPAPGVINIVPGPGGSTGKAIVQHPRIRAISFTGSLDTGKWIMEECAKSMKRVSLELGGKNPVIVMDDANLELALEGVVWGAFGTTGQRCTATSRLILHEKIKDEFIKRLLAKTKSLRVGNGLLPETDVGGPVINKAQLEKIEKYVRIGKEEGAAILVGGNRIDPGLPGYFFEPTIFTDVSPEMRIAQEEIFGPVLSIITVSDFDEAIEVANNIKYGLSSAIYTENVRTAFRAIEKLEAGITYVNAPTIGAEVHLPFGGA